MCNLRRESACIKIFLPRLEGQRAFQIIFIEKERKRNVIPHNGSAALDSISQINKNCLFVIAIKNEIPACFSVEFAANVLVFVEATL